MQNKLSIVLMKVLCLVGFGLVILVNALANILPINGRNTGELSDLYPNLFVPAGITFSIWGIIYIAIFLFTIFQFGIIKSKFSKDNENLQSVRVLFVISCIANISWILSWHYELIFLSLICMLIILASLILIYLKTKSIDSPDANYKIFVQTPFSIYLGWITVATIANITALIVNYKWTFFGQFQEFWTCVVILTGVAITLLIQRKYKDIIYSLVVIWSLAGILIKQISIYYFMYVILTAVICFSILVITAGIINILLKNKKQNQIGKSI